MLPALLLCLTVSPQGPSAAALAGSTAVRLVQSAQPKAEVPLEQMTRGQLRAEYNALYEERPSVAVPVAVIVVGGVGLFGSAFSALFGALFAIVLDVPVMTFVIAGIVALGAGALLVVGILTLRSTLAERTPFNERMQLLQEQIDRIDGRPTDEPPPTPLPQPATVMWGSPVPGVLLARF